jgi:hypothetical protein
MCIPIRQIKDRGERSARLHEARRSSPWARIKFFFLLPKLLHYINGHLPGNQLGLLDHDQAASLYRALIPLYSALVPWVREFYSLPIIARVILGIWFRHIESETKHLGEIMETLSIGTDSELRNYIDSAIHSIESAA